MTEGLRPAAPAVVAVDGRLLPVDEASVSLFDRGLTVGDGAFETLQVVRGVPFALRRHLVRLRRSLAGLGLELATGDDELAATAADVVRANRLEVGTLRLTVTGGLGPRRPRPEAGDPTVVVTTGELAAHPAVTSVVTVDWPRNERSPLAGLKSISYVENVLALDRARAAGATEALFANTRGELCEGAGSNVFVAVGGRLVTPSLSSGCLAGVTRELVCELVEVDEIDLPVDVLGSCEECFLTSSTRDVQAVGSIDRRRLDAPGPLTRQAAAAFASLVARDLDP